MKVISVGQVRKMPDGTYHVTGWHLDFNDIPETEFAGAAVTVENDLPVLIALAKENGTYYENGEPA